MWVARSIGFNIKNGDSLGKYALISRKQDICFFVSVILNSSNQQ
ncbi:hypothetical protein APHNP_0693 [Anaplasma phagocytophilum str. ApNP]|uniref:Uncharacterized protein n=1 Tax=Anaplasma phagocytophilum str. ApNP TaxID=1359153 RepID=A0A0F3NFP7_ANAPH|nr:hypothetical protein APHNP_0693 [Anaplasma phagocytophilum str. ApNP]